MTESSLKNMYESIVLPGIPGDTLRPGGYEITRRALEFCEFLPGDLLLDIGCGQGGTVNLLQDDGYQVFGLDISFNLLCRNKTKTNIFLGNGQNLPIFSNLMDGIFLECTLSVIKNPIHVLNEIYRILKPGGLLVMTDIFARNSLFIQPLRAALSHGCFNSIWSQEDVSSMLSLSNLRQILWEDHSEAIRNLIGTIILNHGSMDTFWCSLFQHNEKLSIDPLNFQLLLSRAKIGYFLSIAQKMD